MYYHWLQNVLCHMFSNSLYLYGCIETIVSVHWTFHNTKFYWPGNNPKHGILFWRLVVAGIIGFIRELFIIVLRWITDSRIIKGTNLTPDAGEAIAAIIVSIFNNKWAFPPREDEFLKRSLGETSVMKRERERERERAHLKYCKIEYRKCVMSVWKWGLI